MCLEQSLACCIPGDTLRCKLSKVKFGTATTALVWKSSGNLVGVASQPENKAVS